MGLVDEAAGISIRERIDMSIGELSSLDGVPSLEGFSYEVNRGAILIENAMSGASLICDTPLPLSVPLPLPARSCRHQTI
jgi:hypothetical protein